MKITFSLNNDEKIVKTDKKQNPLKSIAENGSSLLQCIRIVCTTPELVFGGGEQGIETPCMLLERKLQRQRHMISGCFPEFIVNTDRLLSV